jgi:L-alanine-DL-glutamate epimerase-like enolase superfamily enzyme
LRETLGPEVEICIDFHQRTTPAYAIQLARELAPMRPFIIEDPVRAADLQQGLLAGRRDVRRGGRDVRPFAGRWRTRMVEVQPSFWQ